MDRMIYEEEKKKKKISKCFLGICQEYQIMLQKYDHILSFKYISNKCLQILPAASLIQMRNDFSWTGLSVE